MANRYPEHILFSSLPHEALELKIMIWHNFLEMETLSLIMLPYYNYCFKSHLKDLAVDLFNVF